MIREMVEQPPIRVGGVYLFEIIFTVVVLLIPALLAIATYVLMARLASSWWKSRYLTTRIFLVALLVTSAVFGLAWVLQQRTPRPYSHGDTFYAVGMLAMLLVLLTAILGSVALIRWLVGIAFASNR